MKLYFIGLSLRSPTFDYSHLQSALRLLKGRRVSRRIWMCIVNEAQREEVFGLVEQCLAVGDEMMIRKVPADLRLPQILQHAA